MEPLKPELRGARSGLGVHEALKRRRVEEAEGREAQATARAESDVTAAEATAAAGERFKSGASEAYRVRQARGGLWSAWKACEQLEATALSSAAVLLDTDRSSKPSGLAGSDLLGTPADMDAAVAASSEAMAGKGVHAVAGRGVAGTASGLRPVSGPRPAAYGGLVPPPPSVRTALLLGRLPELWVPAAAGAEAAAEAGAEAGEEAKAEAGAGEVAEAEMAVQGPVDGLSSLSSGLGGAGGVASLSAASVHKQLSLLLSFLREEHMYCLYCGCVFESRDQMAEVCPGPAEEDH